MSSRSRNFTEREKCRLLDVIQRWKHVIENKSTNAISVAEKNEKWVQITAEFNSTAEVPRSQKQLHTAYLNLKRSTRQNVANQNVKKYLQNRQTNSNNDAGPSQKHEEPVLQTQSTSEILELRDMVRELKSKETVDKRGVLATGGGLYQPVLSTIGAKMLAVMGDQIEPLANKFDSASSYYIIDGEVGVNEEIQPQVEDHNEQKQKELPPPERKTTNRRRNVVKLRKNKIDKNEELKNQYYKIKLQSAKLEKRTQLQEFRLALKKQKLIELEIKIREKEYENLCNK